MAGRERRLSVPTLVRMQFQDDVYIATSEPHGQIEACITRNGAKGHMSRL